MKSREWKCALSGALLSSIMLMPPHAGAQALPEKKAELMSFVFRDAPIAELFEMISRKERINIMLSRGVTGNVSVNLYDMTVRQAIYAIAEAGGYTVAARGTGFMISEAKDIAADALPDKMEVRAMRVQYSDPRLITEIVGKHLTRGGKVTLLEQRRMLVVEDTSEGLARIEAMLKEIDAQPQQILIEAKILEITLDSDQNFGVDWNKIFNAAGTSSAGTQGLATRGIPGLFFNIVNNNVQVFLNALNNKGKVHTLATPKLLALENQEAITNIGDKLGYKLTTTINNVTTESVQFLETGVILRVIPSVDGLGRIVMKIHPEVSSGTVSAGIPSKKTTEVTTQMVAEDGQAILIGGLIKKSSNFRRIGVPILGDLPGIGAVFSSTEDTGVSTETIVVITPHIIKAGALAADPVQLRELEHAERHLLQMSDTLGEKIRRVEAKELVP